MKIRMLGLLAALSGIPLLAAALPAAKANAEPAKLVVGTLTCKGHGTVGLILGSQEKLYCNFDPEGNHGRHRYIATITKVGLDVGVKGESTMIWTVLSSTTNMRRGALAGDYGGVSAGAAVGVGASANALIGGNNNSVTLQPVSVTGQTGLNIAVGVAGLTLRHG